MLPRGITWRVLAAGAIVIAASACSSPKPYRQIPRVETKKVAVGAAAAATALTLVNPKAANRTPEKPGGQEKRPKNSGGDVPADVLDRLDESGQKSDPEQDDCPEPEPDDGQKKPNQTPRTLELFPTDTAGGMAPPKRDKCRDKDNDAAAEPDATSEPPR